MALAPDSYQVTSGRPLRTAIVCKAAPDDSNACCPRAIAGREPRRMGGCRGHSRPRDKRVRACIRPARSIGYLVVRGGVEPPTFRFSGLRITVQGWPGWSFSLISEPRQPVID
jgi:hypothetical protein